MGGAWQVCLVNVNANVMFIIIVIIIFTKIAICLLYDSLLKCSFRVKNSIYSSGNIKLR